MTKNEALKLALEALESLYNDSELMVTHRQHKGMKNAITAIREALAQPEREPVAWLHTKIEGVAVPHRPADLDKHPDRWEALYKTPPPCPTCEALAQTVMLDQTYHDAHRNPLSDVEIWNTYKNLWMFHPAEEPRLAGDVLKFARAIEAKLKEKNT